MSEVIKFRPGKSITPRRDRLNHCRHMQVIADEKTRSLICESCGTVIDPFEYLWAIACKDDRLDYRKTRLEKEIKKLMPELEDLKRQERNIKARVRTAKAKLDKEG